MIKSKTVTNLLVRRFDCRQDRKLLPHVAEKTKIQIQKKCIFATLAKAGSVVCADLSQHEGQKLKDHAGPGLRCDARFSDFQNGFLKKHLCKVDMLWIVKWDGDGLEQVDV